MIDTSIPKKQRIMANGSIASSFVGDSIMTTQNIYQGGGNGRKSTHQASGKQTPAGGQNSQYDPFDTYGSHIKAKK